MAAVLSSPSPTHLNKDPAMRMEPPSLPPTPPSDEHFWSNLQTRVDAIIEKRKRKSPHTSVLNDAEREDRFREETMLLLKGFDSVASSLSQLTNNIDAALQGASKLGKPSLTEVFRADCANKLEAEEENQPKLKRQCGDSAAPPDHLEKESDNSSVCVAKNEKLQKAHNLAVSMATKAASLAKELKSIKMDLCFMQERCLLLEEENMRLREGFAKGLRPEEDDLVRLQLEALLAEKSRLANENANLTRENQCLHQLVEYHQMTSQHLSDSYQQIEGISLDFSSPCSKEEEPETPRFDILEFPKLDDPNQDQQ